MPLEIPCRIGVFDSGVGGLSVLRELRRELPAADLTYVADSAHAPYGERSNDFVTRRSRALTRHLVEQGAELIVVACNTATAIAINELREAWPVLPFVGVEPGVKPGVTISRNGRIGVMATPGTLASERFKRLLSAQTGNVQVLPQPCPGLAGLIERLDTDDAAISEAVAAFCAPLRDAGIDTAVLGCTHYAFVRGHIEASLGKEVTIIDTAQAVARQAARRASTLGRSEPVPASASTRLQTTGDLSAFQRITARLWALDGTCEQIDVP